MEFTPGTELSSNTSTDTEDGPEASYWVFEEVPPDQPKPAATPDPLAIYDFAIPDPDAEDYDDRKEALEIDLESVEVHDIEAVAFTTDVHKVHRYRSTKGKSDF
jgi:hypothetical protein